jgi:DNA (cytosine-5)-methyltransferase 1
MMRHASLFSGIGGFDLAARWMGWDNVFNCEVDPFCQKILKHHFPTTNQYGDIKQTDFSGYRGKVDIISGGFPCQPYSQAGKRRGNEDSRHLWPEMLRVIREVRPLWVVGENVHGLVTWNSGLVFREVCLELEDEGFEVVPVLLPAAGVNAPHRRNRVFFVAHATGERPRRHGPGEELQPSSPGAQQRMGDAANANLRGLEGTTPVGRDREHAIRQDRANGKAKDWQDFPTQSPVCGGDDGIPPRLDGIAFPKWRRESIKGFGNAIVPQVAYRIFNTIQHIDSRSNHTASL